MIVHLVASLQEPESDAEYLRQISQAIYDHGDVQANNWLDAAIARKKQHTVVPDWTPLIETTLEDIRQSDVVVVELTHYAFSQGFLVAAALKYKKPILAVSREATLGHTADGITDPLFTYQRYSTKDELKKLVDTFLTQNTIYTKDLRFNMFLTSRIFQYLEETSRHTGISRSETIRRTVQRKAEERHRG
jgi:hypothetical protein